LELRPSDGRESVVLATVQPGPYTAIMRGNNGGTGVGLVEVYDLDPTTNRNWRTFPLAHSLRQVTT